MKRTNESFQAAIKSLSGRVNQTVGENNSFNASTIKREANALNHAFESLVKIANTPKRTENERAHYKRTAELAKILKLKAAQAADRIRNAQVSALNEIEQKTTEHLGLVDSTYGHEVRATLRIMNSKQRAKMLNQIVAEGDGRIIAAITQSPAMLSGMTESEQSKYHELFLQEHAPALIKERDSILDGVTAAHTLVSTVQSAAENLFDEAALNDINQSEQAADQAKAEFNESFAL